MPCLLDWPVFLVVCGLVFNCVRVYIRVGVRFVRVVRVVRVRIRVRVRVGVSFGVTLVLTRQDTLVLTR